MSRPAPRRIAITKTNIDTLSFDGKRVIYWDRDLPGFGVRIGASNRKTYVLQYRPRGAGRSATPRLFPLGVHGAITPAEARDLAKLNLADIARGGDPAEERKRRRKAPTVSALFDFYLDDYAVSANLRQRTLDAARCVLKRYAEPHIGRMKIEDVKIADVRRMHARILSVAGKHQANRTLSFVSSAFSRAVENGWCTINPARGVKKAPTDARERYLTQDEVGGFLEALDEYPDQDAADALRLLLFTGARLNEVLQARWQEFDLPSGTWLKPSAHTKQKRLHRLELAGPALDLLRALRRRHPTATVLFAGVDAETPRFDLKRPWAWVKARARLQNVKLHDLRHTLASHMASAGVPLHVIGQTLGHTQTATTQRYAHLTQGVQRAALERAGLRLTGNSGKPAANQ